jgi:hypothetical protein
MKGGKTRRKNNFARNARGQFGKEGLDEGFGFLRRLVHLPVGHHEGLTLWAGRIGHKFTLL